MIRAFGLVLVAGVAAAACSSADSSTVAPPAAASNERGDAGAGSNTTPSSDDAGTKSDATSDAKPTSQGGTCPAPIGAFPEGEWFHPMHALTKGSCSAQDLDTLSKIGLGSFAARRSMVSASCAACVYSDESDAEWGLLVVVDPDTALTNYAGCSILAGDARECVKKNSAWRFCTRRACASCTSSARSACAENESLSGQCKPFYDDDVACGGTWPMGCTSADDMIVKYCG